MLICKMATRSTRSKLRLEKKPPFYPMNKVTLATVVLHLCICAHAATTDAVVESADVNVSPSSAIANISLSSPSADMASNLKNYVPGSMTTNVQNISSLNKDTVISSPPALSPANTEGKMEKATTTTAATTEVERISTWSSTFNEAKVSIEVVHDNKTQLNSDTSADTASTTSTLGTTTTMTTAVSAPAANNYATRPRENKRNDDAEKNFRDEGVPQPKLPQRSEVPSSGEDSVEEPSKPPSKNNDKEKDEHENDDDDGPSFVGLLSGLFDTLTETATAETCPGKCLSIWAATFMCDRVVKASFCPGSMRCCVDEDEDLQNVDKNSTQVDRRPPPPQGPRPPMPPPPPHHHHPHYYGPYPPRQPPPYGSYPGGMMQGPPPPGSQFHPNPNHNKFRPPPRYTTPAPPSGPSNQNSNEEHSEEKKENVPEVTSDTSSSSMSNESVRPIPVAPVADNVKPKPVRVQPNNSPPTRWTNTNNDKKPRPTSVSAMLDESIIKPAATGKPTTVIVEADRPTGVNSYQQQSRPRPEKVTSVNSASMRPPELMRPSLKNPSSPTNTEHLIVSKERDDVEQVFEEEDDENEQEFIKTKPKDAHTRVKKPTQAPILSTTAKNIITRTRPKPVMQVQHQQQQQPMATQLPPTAPVLVTKQTCPGVCVALKMTQYCDAVLNDSQYCTQSTGLKCCVAYNEDTRNLPNLIVINKDVLKTTPAVFLTQTPPPSQFRPSAQVKPSTMQSDHEDDETDDDVIIRRKKPTSQPLQVVNRHPQTQVHRPHNKKRKTTTTTTTTTTTESPFQRSELQPDEEEDEDQNLSASVNFEHFQKQQNNVNSLKESDSPGALVDSNSDEMTNPDNAEEDEQSKLLPPCTGECRSFFASLLCDDIDTEAYCPSSKQCCVLPKPKIPPGAFPGGFYNPDQQNQHYLMQGNELMKNHSEGANLVPIPANQVPGQPQPPPPPPQLCNPRFCAPVHLFSSCNQPLRFQCPYGTFCCAHFIQHVVRLPPPGISQGGVPPDSMEVIGNRPGSPSGPSATTTTTTTEEPESTNNGVDESKPCPGSCISSLLSFTCFMNAEMTDQFYCPKANTKCCAPKTALNKPESEVNSTFPSTSQGPLVISNSLDLSSNNRNQMILSTQSKHNYIDPIESTGSQHVTSFNTYPTNNIIASHNHQPAAFPVPSSHFAQPPAPPPQQTLLQLGQTHLVPTSAQQIPLPAHTHQQPIILPQAHPGNSLPANSNQMIIAHHQTNGRTPIHRYVCGVKGSPTMQGQMLNRRKRVVGGKDSLPGEWCWQVALINSLNQYLCGGALIGTQWVLTAAHCVTNIVRSGDAIYVRVGDHDLTSKYGSPGAQTLRVATTYIHHNHNSQTLDNDIALLKLTGQAALKEGVCLVCLPARGGMNKELPGKRCTVTGYGYMGESGPIPLHVREAILPIVSESECLRKVNAVTEKLFQLPASSFCAGGEAHNDACQGDGGGPLVCQDEGYYELTGLVSWGFGCGRPDVPGVYVKVSSFIGWINQIISVNNHN